MGLFGSFFVGRVGSGDPTCPTVCFVKMGHVGTLYVGRVGSGVPTRPTHAPQVARALLLVIAWIGLDWKKGRGDVQRGQTLRLLTT